MAAATPANGYNHKADLIPCDAPSSPGHMQIDSFAPTLQDEILFQADGTIAGYSEYSDGGWGVKTYPPYSVGGAKATGSTPLGNSLMDIKTRFATIWDPGLATGPWAAVVPATQRAIKNQLDPKAKTIVLFITDGNDTCLARLARQAVGESDLNALRAAHKAQLLYDRIDSTQAASSVQTYVIGYGGAFSGGEPTRLNWIAWGGSGLRVNATTPIPTTGTGEDQRWNPPGCGINEPLE